jgi:hypothetical protein
MLYTCAPQDAQHHRHAPHLWRALKSTVETKAKAEELTATIKLNALKLGTNSIEWIFGQISEIKAIHASAGKEHPDSYYIQYILNALPRRYEGFIDVLMTSLGELTLESLQAKLTAKEESMRLKAEQDKAARANNQGQAQQKPRRPFAAVAKAGEGSAQHAQQQSDSSGGHAHAFAAHANAQHQHKPKFHGNCFNCGLPGHRIAQCRKPKQGFKPQKGGIMKPKWHKGGQQQKKAGWADKPQGEKAE